MHIGLKYKVSPIDHGDYAVSALQYKRRSPDSPPVMPMFWNAILLTALVAETHTINQPGSSLYNMYFYFRSSVNFSVAWILLFD